MSKFKKNGCPVVSVAMFPKDTNGSGNIFGGVILSHIDIAGAVAARKICSHRIVTVSFDRTEFKKPVKVNDLLLCWAEVVGIGETSIHTRIWVEVERNGQVIPVTESEAVYVAVDDNGRPIPVATGLTDESWRSKVGKMKRLESHCSTCSCGDSGCGKGKKKPRKSKKRRKS